MNSAAAFGSPRSVDRPALVPDQRAHAPADAAPDRGRAPPAGCAASAIGSSSKSRPGIGSSLPSASTKPAFEQRLVGLGGDRRRAEGGAQDGRLQHARQAGDLARGQEIVAHETLDAVLPAVPRVAHAGADDRLQVEGQPLLGAAGDVVQMEAHGPQEFPGAAAVLRLGLRQDRRRQVRRSSPIVCVSNT